MLEIFPATDAEYMRKKSIGSDTEHLTIHRERAYAVRITEKRQDEAPYSLNEVYTWYRSGSNARRVSDEYRCFSMYSVSEPICVASYNTSLCIYHLAQSSNVLSGRGFESLLDNPLNYMCSCIYYLSELPRCNEVLLACYYCKNEGE